MSAVRIQRRRTPGWRMPEGAIYVGRPSSWGNGYVVGMPFEIVDNGVARRTVISQAMSIELFRGYAFRRLQREPDWLEPLRGHDLVCWCPTHSDGCAGNCGTAFDNPPCPAADQPCHADVLLELAGICPECGGDGFVVVTEETCCGDVLPSGECCAAIYGTTRVDFEQVQQPCPGPGPHDGVAVV